MGARYESFKPSSSPAQQPQGGAQIPGRLRDLLGARIDREIYLSTEEAAQYKGSPSREAFIKWARRNKVPLRRANGARRGPLSVRKGDIDWALQEV